MGYGTGTQPCVTLSNEYVGTHCLRRLTRQAGCIAKLKKPVVVRGFPSQLLDILRLLVIFLSLSTQIPGYYLEIGSILTSLLVVIIFQCRASK
jgi:hypothetical protein